MKFWKKAISVLLVYAFLLSSLPAGVLQPTFAVTPNNNPTVTAKEIATNPEEVIISRGHNIVRSKAKTEKHFNNIKAVFTNPQELVKQNTLAPALMTWAPELDQGDFTRISGLKDRMENDRSEWVEKHLTLWLSKALQHVKQHLIGHNKGLFIDAYKMAFVKAAQAAGHDAKTAGIMAGEVTGTEVFSNIFDTVYSKLSASTIGGVGAIRVKGGAISEKEHGIRIFDNDDYDRTKVIEENSVNGIIARKFADDKNGDTVYAISDKGKSYQASLTDKKIAHVRLINYASDEQSKIRMIQKFLKEVSIKFIVIKGLKEELYRSGIASDLIFHPGMVRRAIYIDEDDFKHLLSLENGVNLVIEAVEHEKAHIENADKTEDEIEKIAPSYNVRTALASRGIKFVPELLKVFTPDNGFNIYEARPTFLNTSKGKPIFVSSTGGDNIITFFTFDAATNEVKEFGTYDKHTAPARFIRYTSLKTKSGKPIFVSTSYDSIIRFFTLDTATGKTKELGLFKGHNASALSVHYTSFHTPDGKPIFVSASYDKTAKFFSLDTKTGKTEELGAGFNEYATPVLFAQYTFINTQDGKPIFVSTGGDENKGVRFFTFDPKTNETAEFGTFGNHAGWVFTARYTSFNTQDGKPIFVSAGEDNTIRFFTLDVKTGQTKEFGIFKKHDDWVVSVQYTQLKTPDDEPIFVSASYDGKIEFFAFNVKTGETREVGVFSEASGEHAKLALSACPTSLVTPDDGRPIFMSVGRKKIRFFTLVEAAPKASDSASDRKAAAEKASSGAVGEKPLVFMPKEPLLSQEEIEIRESEIITGPALNEGEVPSSAGGEQGAITVTGITLTPEQKIEVNEKIRSDFDSGKARLVRNGIGVEIYEIPSLEGLTYLIAHPGRGGEALDHSKRQIFMSPSRLNWYAGLDTLAQQQFLQHEIIHLDNPDWNEDRVTEAAPINLVLATVINEGKEAPASGSAVSREKYIYDTYVKNDAAALQQTLAALGLNSELTGNKKVLLVYDTALDPEVDITHTVQAGEVAINRYMGGAIIEVRGTGKALHDAAKAQAEKLKDSSHAIVTIAGDETLKAIGDEGLKDLGKVINVQNPDHRYIPIIGLYDLALRIAYDLGDEKILECLNRIATDSNGIPFTSIDQIKRGMIMILPKIKPADMAEAAEAYKAAQLALKSL